VVRVAIALVVVLVAVAPARGETIGVVVTGDNDLDDAVSERAAAYLTGHQRKTNTEPLEADAVSALSNCFVLADDTCARAVVETRSRTNTTLVIVLEASGKDVAITGRWFVKGNDIHVERDACPDCRRDAWHAGIDRILAALVPTIPAETGHLVLTSSPPGFVVVIDTTRVGKTPLEHDLTVGEHEIELRRGTHPVANRTVTIAADNTTELDIPVTPELPPPPPQSRTGPAIAIGVGAVALAAGAWFLYYGEIGGKDDRLVYSYYEQAPLIGGALATLGAATMVTGIVLYTRAPRTTPVVALVPGGGVLGWTGRF
jgi:hypothetical protein